MNTFATRLTATFALLCFLAACSGSRDATDADAGDASSIRVLVVTATHGYRHAPAIDAAKEVLAAAADTTEFAFDFTEDIHDFNDEKLAGYDVLFFSNSTLRTADDLSATEQQAIADPMKGNWGNFDISYEGFRGTTEGKVALSGTPDALQGVIQVGNATGPTPLTSVTLDGQTLTFSWPAGNFGDYTAVATLEGNQMTGTVKIRDRESALTGTRTGPDRNRPGADQPRVTAAQRTAIMNFVQSGKGIAVAHAGLDAFYNWDAYREMVGGGLFQEHPWTQPVRVNIEEPDNPAVAHFGDSFEINDEIYVLGENPRWNSRVLASLDMESVGADTEPAGPERNDYPISWIREQDGGRVFVTKLGHFPEVWRNPAYLRHVLQGLRMVSGRIAADFSGHREKDVLVENVWPDDIAVDDRGNVWIVELRGKIFYYDAETEQSRQLGELPTTDPTNIEHGLYGIEVDPNFYDGEPYLYIYYAEPETFINTLSRFEFRDGQLDFASERVLLRVPTEPQCCHQAGDLEWGPDGTLYLSTGDTGYSGTRPEWEISEDRIAAFREKYNLTDFHWSRLVDSERTAQNLTDLRGKILRIHKDGTIPKDNPFYGQAGVRWEIYAYGLRNPYRFKVDPRTGTLYIGVVGPDAIYDYDEYDISTKGGENFGWPRSIGSIFYNEWTPDMIPNYTPPMWDYTYQTGGRSATVGPLYQYEGAGAFPAAFQGKLFVFDWSRRWIKWVDIEDGTYTNNPEGEVKATASNVSIPAKRFANARLFDQLTLTTPISMELGPDGALYVAEFDGFWEAGPNAKVTRYRWVTGDE